MMSPSVPRLRPLGLRSRWDDGVALGDPFGLSPECAAGGPKLSREVWAIARRLDGNSSAAGIAERLSAEFGRTVEVAEVEAAVAHLDRALLLDNAAFREARERAFQGFRKEARRPPAGAGSEYPDDPFELRLRIGGLVADDWDMPPLPHAQGLIAPDAPIERAAQLYARSYAAVRHARGHARRIVLLANVGARLEAPLIPLAKPLATPLGEVPIDGEALAVLGQLPGQDQLAHRATGTLERQSLFVRLLFPETPVLALLASDLPGLLEDPVGDADRERLEVASAALARLDELEGPTLMICASPLFREGPLGAPPGAAAASPAEARASGEPRPPHAGFGSGTLLAGSHGGRIRAGDRAAIDALTQVDSEAFLQVLREEDDPLRSRWAAAPMLLVRWLEERFSLQDGTPVRGSTLGYAPQLAPGELSTAASIVFH
jgi:AmmeMemoRadiSam system protein B